LGPKKSSRERGESSVLSSVMGSEVETAGAGVLAPIGTMPISSGRKEGEAGGRVEGEESDCGAI
jgi:hypothetical protein